MEHHQWFAKFRTSEMYQRLQKEPIAYFCAEIALSNAMPTYAGGLGVLAGDTIREAADQQLPMVAMGLYYREGYPSKKVDYTGAISSLTHAVRPEDMGLKLVVDANQKRVTIPIPIQDHLVHAQVWQYTVSTVPVYLLDTNVEENIPMDRSITNTLYDPDKETRLKQEMVLGIGGFRFLETMNIHPSVYHLNESHSALLALQIAKHTMAERGIGLEEAKELACQKIIFTNHTLVSAGNEVYNNDLVLLLFDRYASELQIPARDMAELGLVHESNMFSLTMLSFRLSSRQNAVSKLHAKKAAGIWTEHPMLAVTNGIHIPTWDKLQTGNTIWQTHQENKKLLLQEIKNRTGKQWREDELLVGWARRMVEYKRPLALFEDIKRFTDLARKQGRPIRVVLAGVPHASDEEGIELLKKLLLMITEEMEDVVVYLDNYSMDLAKLLVAGCDVWLNTPVVGFEACGTSGMKAALNGGLPCTTKDGWVDEFDLYHIGWLLDNDKISQSLLDTLEQQIVPLYYARNAHGISEKWVENMQNARNLALNELSATRMLRGYVEKMYLPVIEASKNLQVVE